jgi:hypothetical protein
MRDFSHEDRRRAAAQDVSASVDGHEKRSKLFPTVLSVKILE